MIEILESNELHFLYQSNLVLLVTNSLFLFQYCQELKSPSFPIFLIFHWPVVCFCTHDRSQFALINIRPQLTGPTL